MRSGRRALALIVCLLPALAGCTNLGFYAQSINGHLNIVTASQPIDRLLERESAAPELKRRLELARDVRQFAIEELALPDNDSYRNYVDTGRQFVTWSVFAAEELSPELRTWCFPVMGCVPYRGYFSRQAAEKFAEAARSEGLDVHVGGIPAYSTLGLSADPLLNSMLLYGEDYLAGVIFHELTHQRYYVPGDAEFNEAFAVAVERAGTEAWLKVKGDKAAITRYRAERRRYQDFVALIVEIRQELGTIYAGPASTGEMRAAKAAAIDRLRARYKRLKRERWGGNDEYDRWFDEPINNAKLATVSVYNDLVPAFSRLLEKCGGDYERFYEAVERIGMLERKQRRGALAAAPMCR